MRLIEQAVFTSIETGDSTGYHVVARSPGVCPSDARELCAWGPTHDSILDRWQTGMSAPPSGEPAPPSGEVASFNFHPLPSGLYCISRTILAGANEERSEESEATEERRGSAVGLKPARQPHGEGRGERGDGRGAGADVLLSPLSPLPSSLSAPPRADTHCLLVPPELLARFGNNPWAVIDAAWSRGLWQAQTLLERLAADPGPDAVAALVQAARGAVCLAIAGAADVASLMEGLFHCLPVECRLEFSFTTGLKFSPRRPFRMVAVPDDPAGRQWIASYPNVVVLDVAPKRGQTQFP